VRRMLVLLDAAGATGNTIVVITADHGEAIGEHGLVLDHDLPWDPILRVPLIVAWPGHLPAGRTVSQRVQLVDLVPTLLSLAGVAPEPGLDGRDLSQLLRGGALPEAPAYAEVGGRIRVQYRGDEKLVLAPPGLTGRALEIPQRALFDVGSDPQERDDRSSREPLRAAAAEAALRAWMALEDRDEAGETAPSQAAIEALQQAGYLPLGLAAAHAEEGSP